MERVTEHIEKLFNKPIFFVHVGANDGISSDPIHDLIIKYKWSGILIEPQKNAFQRLVNNYKGVPNLQFLNKAIFRENGQRKLYPNTITGDDGQSSLLLRKNVTDYCGFYEDQYELIECITFDKLIKDFQIKKIDLLVLDAEGYETELVLIFPFHNLFPAAILTDNCPFDYIDDRSGTIHYIAKENCSKMNEYLLKQGYFIYYNHGLEYIYAKN